MHNVSAQDNLVACIFLCRILFMLNPMVIHVRADKVSFLLRLSSKILLIHTASIYCCVFRTKLRLEGLALSRTLLD
jgi:hypothetical protein